jgi:hypothetical protein
MKQELLLWCQRRRRPALRPMADSTRTISFTILPGRPITDLPLRERWKGHEDRPILELELPGLPAQGEVHAEHLLGAIGSCRRMVVQVSPSSSVAKS